jgi:hypothetical protein
MTFPFVTRLVWGTTPAMHKEVHLLWPSQKFAAGFVQSP